MIKTKNSIIKNGLYILAILVFGSILLNLTFMLAAGIFKFYDLIFNFNPEMGFSKGYFILRGVTLFVILAIISYYIFRSKLTDIYKAIWTTVPSAVVLVYIGISTYRWAWLSYTLGTIFTLGILFYLYKTKKSWLYYVAVLFVAIALLIMGITGTDI